MERLTRLCKNTDNGKFATHVVGNYNGIYSDIEFGKTVEKLAQYEDLEEQGLLLRLPCNVGDTIYVITTCKDFGKVLDGTLWGENGGYGTATGYYCPYELNDSCHFDDDFENDFDEYIGCIGGCKCFENKLAIFEDCVESIMLCEHDKTIFLEKCGSFSFSDFGKTVFLTKEAAKAALKMEGGV